MCDGSDNIEHLYILPSRWLFLLQFETIGDAIHEKFQNASCTPIEFFVEENLDSWHLKNHGPRNYLRSFYLAALIHKCEKKNPFTEFRNFSTCRRTRSSQKESDNNGTSSSSSDDETTPKYKKVMGKILMPTSTHLSLSLVLVTLTR